MHHSPILCKRARQTHHIQGGDAEELVWLEDTVLLQDLSRDGYCRVDRVADHVDERLCMSAVSNVMPLLHFYS